MRFVLAGLCLAALAACAPGARSYLYKSGGTVAEADRDIFECRVEAAQQVPAQTRIGTTPIHTTPARTYCNPVGDRIRCYTTGGQTYGGETYSYDANAGLRADYEARCLAARGYTATQVPLCAEDALSEDVTQALSGRLQPPGARACYVPITGNAGNILYLE